MPAPAIASGHFYHFAILMDSIRRAPSPAKPSSSSSSQVLLSFKSGDTAPQSLSFHGRHVDVAQSALLGVGVSFAAFPNEITSHGGQIGRLAGHCWSQLTSHCYLTPAAPWTKPPTTPTTSQLWTCGQPINNTNQPQDSPVTAT